MLTFEFTGVEGRMTETEVLTSGMVGKEVQLLFDSSWDTLTKTAVFRAGEITRVVPDPGDTVTVPEDVFRRPFCKLYVGVYGTDSDGTLVIPTVMAEGPLIRYGADPIEDETAWELPVWQKLQNQIGDTAQLETTVKSDLVSALNEVLGQLAQHILSTVSLTSDTAQLLINILSEGSYQSDQTASIAALAAAFGAAMPEREELLLHWDFQSGSLTDRIAGLEATCSDDVTLDEDGAHISSATSYLMFPLGLDDGALGDNVVEIKFGPMSMTDVGTMRLAMITNGTQPAATGLMWNSSNCWSPNIFDASTFTDLNMFSDKVLTGRSTADGYGIEWYLEDTLICTASISTYQYNKVSLGSSASSAYPFTVEYVKVRPGT